MFVHLAALNLAEILQRQFGWAVAFPKVLLDTIALKEGPGNALPGQNVVDDQAAACFQCAPRHKCKK
jgi:hypothetical protein